MLSTKNNELLTRVGPGTPMGEFLRRFWMPALLASELPGPDTGPIRLRLLGEDLVAFRDTNGRLGILEAHCAHRRTHLYYGRNEECGLRCAFHGWKYDVDGNCVDIPSEPDGDRIKEKVKLVSYPAVERGGVIWTYMGPKDFAAQLPEVEWLTLPQRQRTAIKRLTECNWVQAVEGGIDSSHISFLHGRTDAQKQSDTNKRDVAIDLWMRDRHPVFEVKPTRYGLLIGARRNADEARYYWRITQFLLPFYSMVPPRNETEDSVGAFYWGHAWVPIDDENCWAWSFSANPWRPYSDEEIEWRAGRNGFWGPLDEKYRPLANRDNDYLFDRERQQKDNYSGIESFGDQDSCVQESMGRIADRSREFLGQSDRAIVSFRRLMLDVLENFEKGQQPDAALHGDWYRVRSASLLLNRAVKFEDGAAWLLTTEKQAAAE